MYKKNLDVEEARPAYDNAKQEGRTPAKTVRRRCGLPAGLQPLQGRPEIRKAASIMPGLYRATTSNSLRPMSISAGRNSMPPSTTCSCCAKVPATIQTGSQYRHLHPRRYGARHPGRGYFRDRTQQLQRRDQHRHYRRYENNLILKARSMKRTLANCARACPWN